MQLVGSVQLTNDLDVHVALLHAPSYQKQQDEKFYDQHKTVAKAAREYVDLFGIMQKIPNALDFLIEDAKNHMQTWGSPNPNFLLCNGSLTAQLTMLPEVTNYVTNGEQGRAKLAAGPELASYRGLKIINTRKFSMESGTAPRDLLRRRVRVAEYYRIPWHPSNPTRSYEFYDQSRDTMFRLSWRELLEMSKMSGGADSGDDGWTYDTEFWTMGPKWSEEQTPFDLSDDSDPSPNTAIYTIIKRNNNNPAGVESRFHVHDTAGKNLLVMPQRLFSKQHGMHRSTNEGNLRVTANSPQNNSVDSLRNTASYAPYKHMHIYSEVFGGGIFSDCTRLAPAVNINSMWQYLNWNQLHPLTYGNDYGLQHNHVAVQDLILHAAQNGQEQVYMADAYKHCKQRFESLCNAIPMIKFMENTIMTGKAAIEDYTCFANHADFAWPVNANDVEDDFDNYNPSPAMQRLLKAADDEIRNTERCLLCIPANTTFADYNRRLSMTAVPNNASLCMFDKHLMYAANVQYYSTVNPDSPVDHMQQKSVHSACCALWALKLYVNAMRAMVLDCLEYNAGGIKDAITNCKFDSIKYALKASCLQQAKVQYRYDTANRTQVTWPDHLRNGNPAWETIGMVCLYADRLSSAALQDSKNFMLADLNPHYETPVNLMLQPNMHLDRYDPVKHDDMKDSATSVRPSVWMLQSMLAATYLNENTCKSLLAQVDMNDEMQDAAMDFLLQKCPGANVAYNRADNGRQLPGGRVGNAWHEFTATGGDVDASPYLWMWKTKLMMWLMACFHPVESIRKQASEKLDFDPQQKKTLVAAIAAAMDSNAKQHADVEAALQQLVNPTESANNAKCRFSTDIASNTFGAYVQTRANDPLTIENVPIEHIPSDLQISGNSQLHNGKFLFRGRGKRDCLKYCSVASTEAAVSKPWYDPSVASHVQEAKYWAQDPSNMDEILEHFVLILAKRFFKPSFKFMWNGTGMPVMVRNYNTTPAAAPAAQACRYYMLTPVAANGLPRDMPSGTDYYLLGEHLLHGPHLPTHREDSMVPGGPQDLLVMRPNIEHEMLGIIMGRGGDGELGYTFWGQTELSCYDDAQHGIWGMSYK